jgi:hypothetical protein
MCVIVRLEEQTMQKISFLPTSDELGKSNNPIPTIEARYKVKIVGKESLGSFDEETKKRIREISEKGSAVILNDTSDRRLPIPFKERLFPFCILSPSGRQVTVVNSKTALKPGNFILFYMRPTNGLIVPENDNFPQRVSPSCGMQFTCHAEVTEIFRWRTKYKPYVNLDRDEECIGFSSWSGNLTSWFDACFGTRIQYGMKAGLFPEE